MLHFADILLAITKVIKKCADNLHNNLRMLIPLTDNNTFITGILGSIRCAPGRIRLDQIWLPLCFRILLHRRHQRIIRRPPRSKEGTAFFRNDQLNNIIAFPHKKMIV